MSDSEYIRSPMGEEYHVYELQEVAGHWHSGQWSALYAFCSSGTVVCGLSSEAAKCAQLADDMIEADKLNAIASLPEPEGDDDE
jgi:hypothetical protein